MWNDPIAIFDKNKEFFGKILSAATRRQKKFITKKWTTDAVTPCGFRKELSRQFKSHALHQLLLTSLQVCRTLSWPDLLGDKTTIKSCNKESHVFMAIPLTGLKKQIVSLWQCHDLLRGEKTWRFLVVFWVNWEIKQKCDDDFFNAACITTSCITPSFLAVNAKWNIFQSLLFLPSCNPGAAFCGTWSAARSKKRT